jgi:predicted hotdog family 3-hydroxylacyl-ACP dehydratase
MSQSANSILERIPHRPPMVWVDEILEFSEVGGRCALNLKNGGLYLEQGYLRPSAGIEILAQAYAFCKASYQKQQNIPHDTNQKAFLATVKDYKVFNWPKLKAGDRVTTTVAQSRQFGPITIIKGQVFFAEQMIASGELKVFAGSMD